jgi:hypothetical protein
VKPTDRIGVVAVIWLALFIIVTYAVVSSASEQRRQESERYSACVRDIPKYIDAQETLYMEQECR